MKKSICLLAGLALICCSQIMAQKYTAVDYWKMEQDSAYNGLKKRQNAGETLNVTEKNYLLEYKTKLDEYFEKMSDNEKSSYYKNRAIWESQPGMINNIAGPQEAEIFLGEKSTYTKYLISSGMFGLAYGGALAAIFEMDGGGAAAVPLLTAGASTLIPLLSIKDKKVTYNSLSLSLHGKTIGLLHGAALSLLISGENIGDNEKLLLGLSTLTSIGLGRLGYVLGRDRPWSQGRVGLYSLYGTLMPLEGLALVAAFSTEDPRMYGLAMLAGGAGGYIIADRVAQWNDFTPGDITSTKTFAYLNTMLGFGILADITKSSDGSPALLLIPAAGALGGTIVSHFWLKDARLTNQQGRNTFLATTGGAVMGLGVAALFSTESITPYYLVPYLTGLGSYALIVSKYKKDNQVPYLTPENVNKWKVNLMPQNILLNQKLVKIASTHPGKKPVFLPAVSASINF